MSEDKIEETAANDSGIVTVVKNFTEESGASLP